MNVTRINSQAQLNIFAQRARTLVAGNMVIGGRSQAVEFDPETHTGYARKVLICDVAGTATIAFDDAAVTGSAAYVPPVAQVATVTATGTATTSGVLGFRITSALYAGEPGGFRTFNVTVNVTGSATPSQYAEIIRDSLPTKTGFSDLWEVSGTGANVIITHKVDQYGYANDTGFLLQILVFQGLTGVNNVSSTSTTSGALATGVLWDETGSVDAEGLPLPVIEVTCPALITSCARGGGTIVDGSTIYQYALEADSFLAYSSGNAAASGPSIGLTLECGLPPFEVFLTIVGKIA
jgi:hypothetical protein